MFDSVIAVFSYSSTSFFFCSLGKKDELYKCSTLIGQITVSRTLLCMIQLLCEPSIAIIIGFYPDVYM